MYKKRLCKRIFDIFLPRILASVLLIALAPGNSSAQAIPNSSRVSLEARDKKLSDVFAEIKTQTGFSVWYDMNEVDAAQSVTFNIVNKELTDALETILYPLGYKFSFTSRHIIVSERTANDTPGNVAAQRVRRTGKVVDDKGLPLTGATIIIKGTASGVTADANGEFAINAEPGKTLVINFLGYADQELRLGTETRLPDIVMSETNVALEEVVVTALGIKRSQKALSYNVQEIGSAAVNQIRDANFVNSLSGKVAGLNITSTSAGVGSSTRVVMRGVRSMTQSNNVLYVIDGIPTYNYAGSGNIKDEFASESSSESIADISPEDIESVSVLNGAAAAALYGASAANGAILITTKKGEAGQLKVSLSNQTSFMTPFMLPKFQNSYGNAIGGYESWGDKLADPSTYDPATYFRRGSVVQNTVSLSTGSDRNQTYISLGALYSDGIIPNNSYDRYNVTFRNTTNFLDDKFRIDFSFNYIKQKDRNMIAQGEYYNPLTAVYTFPRGEDFTPIRSYEYFSEGRNINVQFWPYGNQGLNMQNPYWLAYRNLFEHDKKRHIASLSVSYDITDWLNVTGRVRIDNASTHHTRKMYATSDALFAGGYSTSESKGYYGSFEWNDDQIYADVLVNFNKQVGDFSFSANLGAGIEDSRSRHNGVGGTLTIPNAFYIHSIRNDNEFRSTQEDDTWRQQTQSVFLNAEIGWKSMLFLTVTGRNDWSSTLAQMPQQGFFYPSVGISGVISEMVDLPEAISFLKVRGSWALVGNGIQRHISQQRYEYDYTTRTYRLVSYMPIDKLYPEKTRSYEAGIDARFFSNTLNFDLSLYKSNSFKQTVQAPVSSATGYSFKYIQTGNILNKGVEIKLAYTPKWRNFYWSPTFTMSRNWNRIVDMGSYTQDDGTVAKIDQRTEITIGSAMIHLTEGGTLGDIWTTTDFATDQNGNIYVSESGQLLTENSLQKAGTTLPNWMIGFNNSFYYKGISLDVLISARTGGRVLSRTQAILDSYGVSQASADLRDQGGKSVNYGKISAETWYKTIGGKQGVYKYYIYDADNVRLQELRLGYTLPTKWFRDAMRMQVSFVGRNLWMIYCKAPFDPELASSTSNYYQGVDYFMQPSMRNLGFSVKIDF